MVRKRVDSGRVIGTTIGFGRQECQYKFPKLSLQTCSSLWWDLVIITSLVACSTWRFCVHNVHKLCDTKSDSFENFSILELMLLFLSVKVDLELFVWGFERLVWFCELVVLLLKSTVHTLLVSNLIVQFIDKLCHVELWSFWFLGWHPVNHWSNCWLSGLGCRLLNVLCDSFSNVLEHRDVLHRISFVSCLIISFLLLVGRLFSGAGFLILLLFGNPSFLVVQSLLCIAFLGFYLVFLNVRLSIFLLFLDGFLLGFNGRLFYFLLFLFICLFSRFLFLILCLLGVVACLVGGFFVSKLLALQIFDLNLLCFDILQILIPLLGVHLLFNWILRKLSLLFAVSVCLL